MKTLFGDAPEPAPTQAPTRARRSPVRASTPPRAPVTPPAPREALEAHAAAALDGLADGDVDVDHVDPFEAFTPEERARVEVMLRAPTAPGVAHALLVSAAARELARVPTADLRTRAADTATPTIDTAPGGISSCEPPTIDPADLVTCACGLEVHRASLAGHVALSDDFSRWSSHRERMAARMTATDGGA